MEEIISYIMETPENVNGNILREKLKEFKGSGGGAFVVHAADTENDGFPAKILDKTAGEIIAAVKTGYVVLDMYNGTEEGSYMMPFTTVWFDTKSEELVLGFGGFGQGGSFLGKASTENDYPIDTSYGK